MTSPAIIYMTSGTVSPSALAVLVPLLWALTACRFYYQIGCKL